MQRYRSTDSADAASQFWDRSCPVRKNCPMVPGSRYPSGSPSTMTPTRPSTSPAQNRSGRSV